MVLLQERTARHQSPASEQNGADSSGVNTGNNDIACRLPYERVITSYTLPHENMTPAPKYDLHRKSLTCCCQSSARGACLSSLAASLLSVVAGTATKHRSCPRSSQETPFRNTSRGKKKKKSVLKMDEH